ncbi:hypothetical protein Hanom_Chr14g01263511 [Helianthus anomalus]
MLTVPNVGTVVCMTKNPMEAYIPLPAANKQKTHMPMMTRVSSRKASFIFTRVQQKDY